VFEVVNVGLDSGNNSLASIRPQASLSWSQAANDLYLNYQAIPEPSSMALLVVGVAAMSILRCRRRAWRVLLRTQVGWLFSKIRSFGRAKAFAEPSAGFRLAISATTQSPMRPHR
jgi:hypothetical protein